MKIVVLDGYTLNPGDLSWDGFKAMGGFACYDRTAPEDIIPRIGNAEAVIINKTPVTRQTLEACPGIRHIGVLATGYNVVDVKAAHEKNITVTNIPTYGTASVAQYVFALLLELCHHAGHHARTVHDGRWTACPDFCYWDYPLVELDGKTIGIIGLGRIGQAAAKIALAFGMTVLAYDTITPLPMDGVKVVSLDELLSSSDVISLHCPLFDSTRGIINKDSIARMKDSVIIINTSRGPLIVEEDMKAALVSGKVAGFAADVVSTEPIHADNPLLDAPNCLITPHIAWAPKAARARLMNIAVENLKAFMQGSPQNAVKE